MEFSRLLRKPGKWNAASFFWRGWLLLILHNLIRFYLCVLTIYFHFIS